MNLNKLEKIFQSEKPFRLKQAKQAIFRDLIENWNEATTLPPALREKLNKEAPLVIEAEIFEEKDSPPGTPVAKPWRTGQSAKALITLEDGLEVETVLMQHANRNTVCVSSQIGCPLGCVFCATGQMGFKRNLTASEIVEQVLFWARWLKKSNISSERGEIHPNPPLKRREPAKINNIVFMGMGEPFLNYDNVLEAIRVLNDDSLLGIGARHISISTVGVIEPFERMVQDMPQINLAISLHAPNDELRQKLMPINKKYPLKALMAAAENYVAKTNRKLMFEYIMIKGVNDSPEQAKQLAEFLGHQLFFINLITYNRQGASDEDLFSSRASELIISDGYNPTENFTPSETAQVKKFKDILMKAGVQALERYRFGQNIRGACGQLAGKVFNYVKNAQKTASAKNDRSSNFY